MENNQYIVALEIGSSKIVGAIAEKTPDGYISVKHLEKENFTNCVRYGSVQNVENTKSIICRIIKKIGNVMNGTITDVYVGINGRSLHSIKSEIDRNINTSEAITAETITALRKSALNEPIADHKTVDIVPTTYFVDGAEAPEVCGRYGSNVKMKFNRIVMRDYQVQNLHKTFDNNAVGVRVKGYLATPLATGEALLNEDEKVRGCMLADIGAETTTVSIYKYGVLQYLATLPLGGRNITRDLLLGFNITENNAETLKRSISEPLNPDAESVNIDGVNSKEAINYILARNHEIITNINKQIEYAGLKNTDITSIVLIGEGAKLKGIGKKLEELSSCKVRHADNPFTLNILNPDFNCSAYAQVFSLLVQAGHIIPDGESCLRVHSYEPEIAPSPEPEDKKEDTDVPSKPTGGFFEKIKRRINGLLEEDDEE